MTKLKVTEVQSEEEAKEDVVEAGQVRMCEDTDEAYRTVVLVIDAAGSFVDTSSNRKFITAILESSCEYSNYKVGELREANTADKISKDFPILLDAELTYKEAK